MERNTFSKFCLKLFMRLIGLDVCCLIACAFVYTPIQSQVIRTLIQIACIIVLVAFVYPVCHNAGDIDAPLVNVGHRKNIPLKGLYASLIACAPFIVSGLLLVFTKFTGIFPNFISYYKLINSIFFPFLDSLMPVSYKVTELSSLSVLGALSVQIVIPVICMLSYMLGFNRFSFAEALLYKKKDS